MPAIIFENALVDCNKFNLINYEIRGTEPLHDINGHIKNLFEEIVEHVPNKTYLQNVITSSYEGKEVKRGADTRLALLLVTSSIKDNVPGHIYMIFEALCAIHELLYLNDNKGKITAESVLALYGKTFLHGILLRKDNGHNVKKLTVKKLYEKYFHSLFYHCAIEHRLLSGKSMNAENQETTFKFLKGITSGTSNHHPHQILLNCVIRIQATEKLNACSGSEAIKSKISKAAKTLDIQRTTIPFEIIEKYPNEYQSHLERIADFLLYQQTTASRPIFWKETNEGVMFNDNYKDDYSLKPTSHFRSKSLSDELSFVAHCWANCLKFPNNYIPAFKN